MTTAVDRLVDDAWVAVAMFLSHRALLVLSLASRGLRRTALSNGIWEWVLRRDFSKRIVQAAEQAPLWWIPAGGMPAATDERQFVRCYFRLLRSTPPRAKDVHPSQVVKMDAMLHLPRTRWRPATQMALLLTSIASAWCPTSRHASTADDDAQHCDDTRQAFKQNTGVINIESASSRPSERRATKAIAFQALSYARCVVMSSGLLYVPINVNHPDIRRYALDRSSLGVILQDDPERLQCMSTEEQLELIDRKLDPLLGYALACQRLRERRLSRALWTIGASLSVVAFDGVRIARFLPSTMVGIIDSGLSLAAYGLVTLRIACFRLHELMGEGKVWSQAADANSMLQWSAEDVITYLRGHDQAQMVAMLDVLASMSQPLRTALPIGAIGVATAAVAISCGYAQVAQQDPDVRRLVSYINGPTVPLLLSALMAGGAEFVQAWVLYNPQICMAFARLLLFSVRLFISTSLLPVCLCGIAALLVSIVRRRATAIITTAYYINIANTLSLILRDVHAWSTPIVSQLCATWLPGEHDAIAVRCAVVLCLQLVFDLGFAWRVQQPLDGTSCSWPYREVGLRPTLVEREVAGYHAVPAAARRRQRWHGLMTNAIGIAVLVLSGSAVCAAAAKATASVALALLNHVGRTLAYARFGL
jgi:hypothetical protein